MCGRTSCQRVTSLEQRLNQSLGYLSERAFECTLLWRFAGLALLHSTTPGPGQIESAQAAEDHPAGAEHAAASPSPRAGAPRHSQCRIRRKDQGWRSRSVLWMRSNAALPGLSRSSPRPPAPQSREPLMPLHPVHQEFFPTAASSVHGIQRPESTMLLQLSLKRIAAVIVGVAASAHPLPSWLARRPNSPCVCLGFPPVLRTTATTRPGAN